VAYLVGHREFYSLDFRVTRDVLIPRPETELLVLTLLDLINAHGDKHADVAVADVGTGSGIIGLTVARQAPRVRSVLLIDVSPAALAVAKDNALRLGVADRVELVESDLFDAISPEQTFDFIASNPPYVSTAELATLARDVGHHEPELALAGGESGIAVIERLIPQAAKRLASGGSLLLEVSPMLQQRVEALIETERQLEHTATINDLAGLPRVVVARRKHP
jgi:release factor glutamine methyltransferase